MINVFSLGTMEERFQDVHDMMHDVRAHNREYTFKDGRLIVFIPGHVLVVESVDCILMYSLVHKKQWDELQEICATHNLTFPSLVGFINANHWNVSLHPQSLYLAYTLVVSRAEHLTALNIEKPSPVVKGQPSLCGAILYALVGVANSLKEGERGISDTTTIYGIFSNGGALRDAISEVRERIAKADDDYIREASHEFAIHPFIPNEGFGFGTEVSMSFCIY